MKILLAVDGSEYTRKMLDYVLTNRALFDASHQFVLFNAQPPLPPHARSALGSQVVNDYYKDEAIKVLTPAHEKLAAANLKVEETWKVGPAGETIAAVAREGKFDMIMVGTHGHGALARLVMGSVTARVLAECTVPVLLIR